MLFSLDFLLSLWKLKSVRKLNEQELASVIAERGYLVCWSAYPHYIGKRIQIPEITDINSSQPFVVIAETDKDDHDAQLRILGEEPRDFPYVSLYGESGQLICHEQVSWRFYRVTTD
jgi:hypothetical protein